MTKTSRRKPRPKVERRVHLYAGCPMLLELVVGKDTFSYWLEEVADGAGRGFEVRKIADAGQPPSTDVYHVHIDDEGHHSCDCPGGSYHGHCKHLEAIHALITAGKLPVRERLTPRPEQAEERPARQVNPNCFLCGKSYEDCRCEV